ncbi:MAG: GNAT family N-acetyltransferase, partial [Clostridia bacterium]
FAVDNESRGNGLGTIMMEEVKNRLKAQNTRRIVLVTIADDQTTSFYRQQGFEEDRKAVVMKTEF